MYPLKMSLVAGVGFAVANDEKEHKSLTEHGYGPEFVAQPAPVAQANDAQPAQVEPRRPGRPKKVHQ